MFKPLRDQILVRPFKSSGKSVGGIFVSEAHTEDSCKVEIIAVGSGTKKHPMRYRGGEVGFRIKGSGQEFIIEGQKHYLINQSWLTALIKQ